MIDLEDFYDNKEKYLNYEDYENKNFFDEVFNDLDIEYENTYAWLTSFYKTPSPIEQLCLKEIACKFMYMLTKEISLCFDDYKGNIVEIISDCSILSYLGHLHNYFPLNVKWYLKCEQFIPLTHEDKILKENEIWYSEKQGISFKWFTGAEILAEIINRQITTCRIRVNKHVSKCLNPDLINTFYNLEEEHLLKENSEEALSYRLYNLLDF